MPTRGFRLVLALALAFSASACAFVKPTLTFKNARVSDASLEGATLQLTYSLKNPNPIGVDLASVSYKLEVEGKHVVSGKPPNGLRVAAQGSSDLVFPARVKFLDIAPVVQTFLTRDQASYRASGSIGVRTPIGIIELPLSYSGTFPVPKVPQFRFSQPRVQGLTLAGARVVIPVQITNKNPFPLPMGGMGVKLSIAGAQVVNTGLTTPATLAAGTSHTLEIPIDLNFLQAGMAVASAIQNGNAHVKLEGALKCGGMSLPVTLSENLRFR